jgi:hypothetical protein
MQGRSPEEVMGQLKHAGEAGYLMNIKMFPHRKYWGNLYTSQTHIHFVYVVRQD